MERSETEQKLEAELRRVMGCTCLRVRRAARRVTQLYEHALEPAGLTANQFSLLSFLYNAGVAGSNGLSIGAIADWLAMDPTTLNRNLKPLAAKGLVKNAPDPADGRVRIVLITDKGRRTLRGALPLWRGAQARVEKMLGPQPTAELNKLLDLSAAKLRSVG